MNFQEQADVNQETFEVNGNTILVSSKTLRPSNTIPDVTSQGRIAFLPGWGVESDSKSALIVGQSFADASGQSVTIFDTFATRVDDRSIDEESVAVARSLVNSEQNEITIVGYSEGGIKAAGLVNALTETEIHTRGLVLMSPAGLYRQKESSLIGKFFRISHQGASQVKSSGANRKDLASEGFKSAKDLALSIGKEAARSNLGYARRLRSQLRTIATKYPGYRKIATPIVLIQGINDVLSDPEITLPGYKNRSIIERERALQQTIFPESPHVRMVVGRKNGIHNMPYLRSRQIAEAALYILKRSER